jgi:hypothetical protein
MGAMGRAAAEERYSWEPIAAAVLNAYRRDKGEA